MPLLCETELYGIKMSKGNMPSIMYDQNFKEGKLINEINIQEGYNGSNK